jgi:hypothetical protein
MIRAGITKVKTSFKEFERATHRGLKEKQVKEIAYKRAQEISRGVTDGLERAFNAHEVTEEIEGGPGANNSSGTLIGSDGNLFTFIGFYDGDNPVSPVRQYLRSKGAVYKTSKFVKLSTKEGMYNFRVNAPTMKDIEGLTPMPWESGRSWVKGVERGISGVGNYMYKQTAASRSGGAIQIKGKLGGSFKRVKYMSALLNNYAKNLRLGIINKK